MANTSIRTVMILGIVTQTMTATPPLPPEGKRWVRNELFSDEFNGTEVDSRKWFDHHPSWRGRVPGIFLSSQVSIRDGYMRIKGEKLDKPIKHGSNTYTIAGGAVVSKTQKASFGYYECRFKAAATTMSTTFWLSTRKSYPGEKGNDRYGLELDIQECIGRSGDFKGKFFATGMNSNSHFWYDNGEKPRKKADLRAKAVRFDGELASKAFQTYGGWWKDESTAVFYFNKEKPQTMHFYDKIKKKPFDKSMGLNMVCETYPFPWIELPNDEELADPEKNTCYYDWVRSYVLVDADDPNTEPIHGMAPENIKLYEETVSLDQKGSFTAAGNSLKIPLHYKTNEDRKLVIRLLDKKGKTFVSRNINAYTGFANLTVDLKLSSPLPEGNYTLKALLKDSQTKAVIVKDRLSKVAINTNSGQ